MAIVRFLSALVIIILISMPSVLADGGYFPYHGYWVRPGQQRAIIFYEDNVETLILTTDFQGNAKDLAWIIPTPNKPEVTKASEDVFESIAELIQQVYYYDYGMLGVMESMSLRAGGGYARVTVIESKQVEYYDVDILFATSSDDLVKWFNDNNYTYPKEYEYVLKHYINKKWYFTAIKISPEAQGATSVIRDLKEGHPTPVKLSFSSEKVVFPLRISSIDSGKGFKISTNLELNGAAISHLEDIGYDEWSKEKSAVKIFNTIITDVIAERDYDESIASNYSLVITRYDYSHLAEYCNPPTDYCVRNNLESKIRNYFSRNGINLGYGYEYMPIQLYVIADNKYKADKFYIQYGNWIDKEQIQDLGSDEDGNPLIEPKKDEYFLTYLYASYQKNYINDDVFLKKAEDNKKVNAGPETWQVFVYGILICFVSFMVWIFSPIGTIFIMGTLIVFLASNRIVRILGWLMEIFSFATTFIIGLIFFLIFAIERSLDNYAVIAILIAILLIMGLMILLIILQLKYKKIKPMQ